MSGDISRQNGRKGGRKKGYKAIQAEKAREYVIKRVSAELAPILDAQIDAAMGMRVMDKDGRVYTRQPELRTGEYLINQSAGRPVERLEHSGRDGKPLIIRVDE